MKSQKTSVCSFSPAVGSDRIPGLGFETLAKLVWIQTGQVIYLARPQRSESVPGEQSSDSVRETMVNPRGVSTDYTSMANDDLILIEADNILNKTLA